MGQGVVWYSSQFCALYFLQQVSKLDALTTSYIVGAGLIIGTPTLVLFGWLSDIVGRKPVILSGMLLAALTYYPLYLWLGTATQPGNINYSIAIHRGHSGRLCRNGVRADRRVPRRIFPRPDPLHVGVGALSRRQWLGRRIGAVHHHCGVPGNRERRLCSDLSDCGSGGMLRAQSVSHAGDLQDQYLGADSAKA
jgi:hypothetical protein